MAHAFDKGSLNEQGMRRNNKLDMGMAQSLIFMFVLAQCRLSCWLATPLASLPETCIFSLPSLELLISANLTVSNSVVYGLNNAMYIRSDFEKSERTMQKVKTNLF